MEMNHCPLFKDILPLYKEGGLSEETKAIVEGHLEHCAECSALYNSDIKNVFDKIDFEGKEPEIPKEKRFLKRLKITVFTVAAAALMIFAASNVITFAIGRTTGIYGERFKLAEQKHLFLEVNQEAVFGNERVVLEKALIDSTVTSIIFKTDLNLDAVDSIIMKDDRDNYYGRSHTLFNSVPVQYQKINGYTVLNFKAVPKDTEMLVVELVNWKKDSSNNEIDKIAVFELKLTPESVLGNISEKKNAFQTNLSDFVFSVDKIICSASQTEMSCTFNYESSRYDGITLGWYHKDYIDNKGKITLTDTATGNMIPVLSTEDITHELLVKNQGLKKTSLMKVLFNPMEEGIASVKLAFMDLYGYYSLGNVELPLSLQEGAKTEINRAVKAGEYVLEIKSAEAADGKLTLAYSVRDQEGNTVKGAVLDARIHSAADKNAVPREGVFSTGSEVNTVQFETAAGTGTDYVITLARLGEEIVAGPFEIPVRDR